MYVVVLVVLSDNVDSIIEKNTMTTIIFARFFCVMTYFSVERFISFSAVAPIGGEEVDERILKIMERLGWPASVKSLLGGKVEDGGVYLFGGDIFVSFDGRIKILGEGVPPRVGARIMSLYEVYGKSFSRAFLRFFDWSSIRPTSRGSIVVDGLEIVPVDSSMFFPAVDFYDPVRGGFSLRKKRDYALVDWPSADVKNELHRRLRKGRVEMLESDFGVEFALRPFYGWVPIDGDIMSTGCNFAEYSCYEVIDSDFPSVAVFGPWVRGWLDDDVFENMIEYIREGWVFDGKTYRKKIGNLFVVESVDGSQWIENRFGVRVIEYDGIVDVVFAGKLNDVIRLIGLL